MLSPDRVKRPVPAIRCALVLASFALLKAAAPQQPPPDFRLRISVNLVQVDATVTDSHGKPVSGLTRDDFQILLDDAPQRITFCNFIEAGRPPAPSPPPRSVSNQLESVLPSMPATSLKREEVRRIVVLFVDDLSMSSESVPAVRNGLRKFVEKQLQPGDLVAIVRASAGLGALQDFTTDPQRLLAAAAEVRWKSCGEGGAQAYKPIGINPTEDGLLMTSLGQAETRSSINICTVAATSSLWKLLHGMADLPGRKSVVILADNLPLGSPKEIDPSKEEIPGTGMAGPILASMRRVVDESVRAGVVLYAIDTRGLNSLRAQASDNLRPVSPLAPPTFPSAPSDHTGGNWIGDKTQARRDEYREGQWGSLFLASQTGGFMVTEANFIDAGIERVMNDQNGYYLLAFVPPPEALAPGRNGKPVYRRLRVQVLRPSLHVRSHQGFFGVTDQDRVAVSSRPELQLAAALESPFQSSGIGIEIQSGFLNARKNASLIRTAIVLDGRDLALTGPPIHRSGIIHLLVRAFDVTGGQLEGGINQTLRIDLNEDGYERALK